MAEKGIEVKKTLKYQPSISRMVIEAGELEMGLNKALNPLIKGYKGCHLQIEKQTVPGGSVVQFPRFIIAIDKFSDSVTKESPLAYILGSTTSFSLKESVKEVLRNFIVEKEELTVREKQKSITVTLNFFKCLQQIFEDNEDFKIKYDSVDYFKTKFNPEIKRYIWLSRVEGSLREDLERAQKTYMEGQRGLSNFFYDGDYEEEGDDDEDIYNTNM